MKFSKSRTPFKSYDYSWIFIVFLLLQFQGKGKYKYPHCGAIILFVESTFESQISHFEDISGAYSSFRHGSTMLAIPSRLSLGFACILIINHRLACRKAQLSNSIFHLGSKIRRRVCTRTHAIKLISSREWSIAFCPVTSSKRTTPKLYTSLAVESWWLIKYCGSKYLHHWIYTTAQISSHIGRSTMRLRLSFSRLHACSYTHKVGPLFFWNLMK